MTAKRDATVLFAAPNSVASRYEAARSAITSAVLDVADSTGGRVVDSAAGRVMVLFATPDAAASAASKIHAAVGALPAVGGTELGVQIGFHTGPILRPGDGMADETVKMAWRLAQQAHEGQTLTSEETAGRLNPAFRSFSRPLHLMQDDPGEVWLYEISSWHQRGVRPQGWAAMAVLRLTYRDQLVVCSRQNDAIIIGRAAGCDLVVDTKFASRIHCTIFHEDGHFKLRDHSSNGTFVTIGNFEMAAANDELELPDLGLISIGAPRAEIAHAVEFCYALVT
jgi:adenylate cyclase